MKHLIAASLFCLTSLAHAVPLLTQTAAYDTSQGGASSHQRSNPHGHDPRTAEVVMSAMAKLDIPYQLGGNSREAGFDCSGLVHAVFKQTLGLVLPRRAAEQAASTERIEKSQLRPGDLVFFNTLRRSYSHVGIYIGDNKFIHAPRTGARVRVENMGLSYWRTRFDGARRVSLADASAPPRLSSAFASNNTAPSSTYQLNSAPSPEINRTHGLDEISLIASRELSAPNARAALNTEASAQQHHHHISLLSSTESAALQSTPAIALASLSPAAMPNGHAAAEAPRQSLSADTRELNRTASTSAPKPAAKASSTKKDSASAKSTKAGTTKATQKAKANTSTVKANSGKRQAKVNPSKREKSAASKSSPKSKRG